MSVIGSPENWADFIEQKLPQLLQLTIDTWCSLPRPLESRREDDITKIVCRALGKNRTVRELPFYVQTQVVELEPTAGQDLGRLDIAFLPTGLSGPPNESIYFCLECKRLNVLTKGKIRTYASEYVVHGMMRFVSGQYSSALRHGGMLGYVLDGNVRAAIGSVANNVQSHCAELGMDPLGELPRSTILPNETGARETQHRRKHDSALFQIHHLFVPGSALQEPPACMT